jgi:predicted permease
MLTLRDQPLGFRTDRISAVWVGLPRIRYQNNKDVAAFFTRVDQKLHELPGVEAAALGYPLPLQGNHFWTNFTLTGKPSNIGEYEQASLRFIDSGFLPLMNIPVLVGRNFSDADDPNSEPVAIISESFAHKYWPSENALGKYITIFRDTPVPRRVVGVVGDVRSQIEDAPPPTMYVSYRQMSFPSMQVLLLSQDSSNSALIRVRQAVQSVDPQQPVEDVDSMVSIVHESLEPWRFALSLLGGLAGLAAAITGFGLFAVISYLVRERTKEIGIRMAVGASRAQVMRMIFSGTLRLVISGAFVGVGMTLLIARLTTTRLYAIHTNDPSAFLSVVLVVTIISIAASLVPARRAARIEPVAALREG